jgi:hypothetical protein
MKKILLVISLFIGSTLFFSTATQNTAEAQVVCTADARLCPDGSYVSRVAPSCAFAPCPTELPSNCPTNQSGTVMCPVFDPAPNFCSGGQIVPGEVDECGCQGAPTCIESTPIPTPSPAPEGCFYQEVQCIQAPCNPVLVCPSPSPSASPTVTCQSNADCSENEKCYQPPMPECPEGMMCAQVMPVKRCVAIDPVSVCQSDADCFENEFCYQPPMPECPEGMMCAQVMPAQYCKLDPVSNLNYHLDKEPLGQTSIPIIFGQFDGYGVSAVLKDSNNQVVKNQREIHYIWTSLNPELITVEPHSPEGIIDAQGTIGCTYGVNLPCPKYNASMSFLGTGTAKVKVQALSSDNQEIATEEFTFVIRSKKADLNNDNKVNIKDFTILQSQFMEKNNPLADINGDGIVNIKDFTIMMSEFNII